MRDYIGSNISSTNVKRIVLKEWKKMNFIKRLRCYWPCFLKYFGVEEENIYKMIFERINPGYKLIRSDEEYLVILR